jgi:hypothetical protein
MLAALHLEAYTPKNVHQQGTNRMCKGIDFEKRDW